MADPPRAVLTVIIDQHVPEEKRPLARQALAALRDPPAPDAGASTWTNPDPKAVKRHG